MIENKENQSLEITNNFGYILGVLCGDGFVSKNSIGLNVKDKDFALNFKKIFEVQFKKEGKIHFYNGLWTVLFHSRYLVNFLKPFDYRIVQNSPIETKSAFLRGMFDSEGSVYYKAKIGVRNRKVELCNTDYDLMLFCKNLLENIGVRTREIDERVRKERTLRGRLLPITKFYRLTLRENKENFLGFRKLVGFSIKRKEDKLDTIINSYLKTKSKWGNLRFEVRKLKGECRYTDILEQFNFVPRKTIDKWLYSKEISNPQK